MLILGIVKPNNIINFPIIPIFYIIAVELVREIAKVFFPKTGSNALLTNYTEYK